MMNKETLGLVSPRGIGKRFHSLIALLVGALIIIMHTYQQTGAKRLVGDEKSSNSNSLQGCNLYSGSWVFDNKSYPLYSGHKCEFIFDEFACDRYGRKDLKYQQWRWQPHDCDLPRFDAAALLEKLRGKRLVFVGDSLNRNQWLSLICLVESSIPPGLKFISYPLNGSLFSFKAVEYNASIDFYWSPYLVETNCDDPYHHHGSPYTTIRIEAIENHAKHWIDADVLIFDSYSWWLQEKIQVIWGLSEKSNATMDIPMLTRYEMGLKTWADWLEVHINRTKTKLFFVSWAPYHYWGEKFCYNETEPTFKEGSLVTLSNPKMMQIVEDTIDRLEVRGMKVHILNITQLSQDRKDGHPSIYKKHWWNVSEEQLSNPSSYSDCTHWCLPGVPDVWNELLYVKLLNY